MADEPTLGEVMRRLDSVASTMSDLAVQMREDRQHAASTYVRRDVYAAERIADHADVEDVRRDVRALDEERTAMRNFRRQVGLGAALGLLGIAGSFGIAIFGLLVGGGV